MREPALCHMLTTKTQISQGIQSDQSLLRTQAFFRWTVKTAQTGQMPSLHWVHRSFCCFCQALALMCGHQCYGLVFGQYLLIETFIFSSVSPSILYVFKRRRQLTV